MVVSMKITDTNLFALGRAFGDAVSLPASTRFDAVTLPHLRRCVKAGLVELTSDRSAMVLTESGISALAARQR